MKKNVLVRVSALAVAGVMLTGSLAFAAIGGSPYEVLKDAIFNSAMEENFTMNGTVNMTFNGEVYESEDIKFIQTEDGTFTWYEGGFSFDSDVLAVHSSFFEEDGTQWYSARPVRSGWNHSRMFMEITPEMRQSTEARFFEALVDLFVGDLKNNITMSTSGGVRRISGAINHNQIPMVVQLGIELIIEENLRWQRHDGLTRDDFFGDELSIPITSLNFDLISGVADIDSNGRILFLGFEVIVSAETIFGDTNVIGFNGEFTVSDKGTSVLPEVVMNAKNLFTPEFVNEIVGHRYSTVYFTMNEDGSINEDSITEMWPGSRRWQLEVEEQELLRREHERMMLEYLDLDPELLDEFFGEWIL